MKSTLILGSKSIVFETPSALTFRLLAGVLVKTCLQLRPSAAFPLTQTDCAFTSIVGFGVEA